MLVKSHASNSDVVLSAPVSYCVHYLTVWSEYGGRVSAFHDSDPEWVSAVDLAPWDVMSSDRLRRWRREASDTFGCVDPFEPVSAIPTLALTDEQCPSFLVLKDLCRNGWNPKMQAVEHTNDALACLDMDGRRPSHRKPYYQVLLDLPRYLTLCPVIRSDQPLLFYKLLMAGQAVVPGLKHKEYQNQLKLLNGEPVPLPLADGPFPVAIADVSDDDICVSGGAVPKRAKAAAKKALPHGAVPLPILDAVEVPHHDCSDSADHSDGCSSHSSTSCQATSSDESASGASSICIGGKPPRPRAVWKNLLGGVRLKFEHYEQVEGKKQKYDRYILKCCCHGSCFKKRSVSVKTCDRHGPGEPIAYLLAWSVLDAVADEPHNSMNPTREQVDAFICENPSFLADNGIVLD